MLTGKAPLTHLSTQLRKLNLQRMMTSQGVAALGTLKGLRKLELIIFNNCRSVAALRLSNVLRPPVNLKRAGVKLRAHADRVALACTPEV